MLWPLSTGEFLRIKLCHINCGSIHTNYKTKSAQKPWVDKETEVLCEKKGIETNTTERKNPFSRKRIFDDKKTEVFGG